MAYNTSHRLTSRSSNTRKKILESAHELFSREDICTVSLRRIANETNISYGNLCYHYCSKEEILSTLYEQMLAQQSEKVPNSKHDSVKYFVEWAVASFHYRMKFDFFYQNLIQISRIYPNLADNFSKIASNKKSQMRQYLNRLVELEKLHPEPTPGYYDRLVRKLSFFCFLWLSTRSFAIISEFPQDEKGYLEFVTDFVIPHLTDAGLSEMETALKIVLQK